MLRCCEEFANKHSLRFNPTKTQLIRFSWSPSSSCMAYFTLCGQQLSFVDTITHLGHLIHYNLSDVPDINHKLRDMVKKANCLLASFPRVGTNINSYIVARLVAIPEEGRIPTRVARPVSIITTISLYQGQGIGKFCTLEAPGDTIPGASYKALSSHHTSPGSGANLLGLLFENSCMPGCSEV